MSWTYRGFEGNDEHETPWYAREIELFEDIIDMLPQNGTTYVSTEHYHSKLVSPDGTVDPAVVVIDSGFVGVGIATPLGLLHVYEGDSAGVADAGADEVIIESDGNSGLSILVGDDAEAKLFFADQDQTGYIRWYNAGIDLFPDGATQYLSARGGTFEVNPGSANISTGIYWDGGVAFYIDGATGNTVINYSSTDSDTTINWDSGVGLFVQGSDGVVGVGTATLQAWKTTTYESVLSLNDDGSCAFAAGAGALEIVANAYWAASDAWKYAGTGRYAGRYTISGTSATEYHTWYISTLGANPGDALSWVEVMQIEGNGADGNLIINSAKSIPFYVRMNQKDAAGHPCLYLEQADQSEGCIDFIASDRGSAAWGVCSVASVRVELNGTVYRIGLLADG